MLEPRDRSLLLDQLRPPVGYKLDFAIGTTFTLDLVALLGAPLAFALLDRTDREGRLATDPVALIEALRRNADKFVVFCQAGRIAVPPVDRSLLTLLERNVVEVTPRAGGVFHPKVWALRFLGPDGDVRYRFLCGTRNVTFDRSWDTMLSLEGPLRERKNGFSANKPLAEFFAALPGLAVNSVEPGIQGRISQFQEELRKVDFELPEPFEAVGFIPIGHDGKEAWPFDERIERFLIISPFVTKGFLDRLEDPSSVRLVSRGEELALLDAESLGALGGVDVFDDEQIEEPEVEPDTEEEPGSEGEQTALTGLHAKLFVADAGWNSTIWTGSANATDAAFKANVEFLVALEGKKSKCGIEALLKKEQGEPGIASFLKPWVPSSTPPDADPDQRALEVRADRVQRTLACAGLLISYTALDGGGGFQAVISLGAKQGLQAEPGVTISVWPITCREEAVAKVIDPARADRLAYFESLSAEAPTSFLAFRLDVTDGARVLPPRCFTLNIPATGMPEDRHLQLLLRIVGRREAFEDYLRMLLAGVDAGGDGESLGALVGLGAGDGAVFRPEQPLFEMLLRALHQDPARIDDVGRLVNEIEKSGRSEQVFPAGFGEIWKVIDQARKALTNEAQPAT